MKQINISTALTESLEKTAQYILSVQLESGAIPWFTQGKLDPWDHVEAAMGLSVAGHHNAAKNAYFWLNKMQLDDGSWHANYNHSNHYLGETSPHDLRETNFIAYISTGVWHYFLATKDHHFLEEMFPCIEKSVEFILQHQSEHGEIAWAVDSAGTPKDDALITACSSILKSLDCAYNIASTQNIQKPLWATAASKLKHALKTKPERFDRTWESKARFSMDWYYPILAGIYSASEAQQVIKNRWDEFVVTDLGCRCVNDEPWVTMAETSELVMALVASDQHEEAQSLFATLQQWRDTDGGYWTGYVFRDKTIWPEEKTTWTAGAVLLAADALFSISRASTVFAQPTSINGDARHQNQNPK